MALEVGLIVTHLICTHYFDFENVGVFATLKKIQVQSALTYLINVHARFTILDFFSTLHALIVCLHP